MGRSRSRSFDHKKKSKKESKDKKSKKTHDDKKKKRSHSSDRKKKSNRSRSKAKEIKPQEEQSKQTPVIPVNGTTTVTTPNPLLTPTIMDPLMANLGLGGILQGGIMGSSLMPPTLMQSTSLGSFMGQSLIPSGLGLQLGQPTFQQPSLMSNLVPSLDSLMAPLPQIPQKTKEELEAEKERERKKQLRLVRARALKFDVEDGASQPKKPQVKKEEEENKKEEEVQVKQSKYQNDSDWLEAEDDEDMESSQQQQELIQQQRQQKIQEQIQSQQRLQELQEEKKRQQENELQLKKQQKQEGGVFQIQEQDGDQDSFINNMGFKKTLSLMEIKKQKEQQQKELLKLQQQEVQMEEEEDELDKFMKNIEGQAVKQESFQLSEHFVENIINTQNVQQNQTSDKFINRLSGAFGLDIGVVTASENGKIVQKFVQKFDEDQMEEEIDETKVITLEDIQRQVEDEAENGHEIKEEDDDENVKQWYQELKQKQDKEFLEMQQKLEQQKQQGFELTNHSPQSDEDENYFIPEMEDETTKKAADGKGGESSEFFEKQKKIAEKKDLKPVDHTQIKYEQFRKCFYIEVKEISDMTPEQVNQYRKEQLGDMKVRGIDCPKPIQNWYQCGLSDRILKVLIDKKKHSKPFPIQSQSLPAVMSGRDCIGIAETGSGKTLAYLLPMFRHIMDQRPLQEGDGPVALVLTPTRELATQIYYECRVFTKALGLNVVCVYGGTGVSGQLSDLKRGTEIVVATPGRMIDVLCTSNGKITNLRRVTYVVLDEADRMFDLGFEPQISKILNNVRPDRQTVMFSATFPKSVESLAKKILNKPIEVIVGNRGQVCANVEQQVEIIPESEKFVRLLEILGDWNEQGSVLIFVDKQSEADELFKELLKHGYLPLVLHGGQDQQDREFTISDFKKGVRNIMVATSICARGLDIKHLVLVINFKCPDHLEDYIHRIGRTGRAGNKGTAITFITPDEEQYASILIKALEMSKNSMPQELIDLSNSWKEKVKKGEVKDYTKDVIRHGKGFKFDEAEYQKGQEQKNLFKRQFELENELSDNDIDEDEIFKQKTTTDREKEKQTMQQLNDKESLEMIQDPIVKQQIIAAATKAAKDAISEGKNSQQVLDAAQEAIKSIMVKYKPTANTVEKGLERAISLRDQFQTQQQEESETVAAELEINDYPLNARQKVMNKEYQQMIHDLTNCVITLRGTFVEPGKKQVLGQRKLFLHIEGDTKYNVANAYREIKRVLEESAMQTLNGGRTGKYKI